MATQPKVRKGTGPDQLPQGAATQLNASATDIPAPDNFAAEPMGPVQGLPPELQDLGDRLFAPTDRPDEPVTDGLPFGPGRNFLPPRDESPQAKRGRLAAQLESSSFVTPEVAEFAARLKDGV